MSTPTATATSVSASKRRRTHAGSNEGDVKRRNVATAAAAALHKLPDSEQAPSLAVIQSDQASRHFTLRRFKDASISQASKDGIKHEFMSDVQDKTLDIAMTGQDLLVQAKTGTGKTLAFLLPAIERLETQRLTRPPRGISILVLSPTRELAMQIEQEAKTLLEYHHFEVQHIIGGTNANSEASRLRSKPCDVLIATPGRLLQHLRDSNLATKLNDLRVLVYDEADRLLDQGFKPDLDKIATFLPPRGTVSGKDGVGERQTLLFSATVSQEIKKIAHGALRQGYKFVSTLTEDETNTHEHVKQTSIIVPQSEFLQTTYSVLLQNLKEHPGTSKCMVFFPTARQVGFAAAVLSQAPGLPPVVEIHSRKSQSSRTKVADQFKVAKSAVLLSSDVTARGMDFPDVTLVLQVGVPSAIEQYIHRLGRTARAGASGRGIVILSPEEQFFLREAASGKDSLPITPSPSIPISPISLDPFIAVVDEETKAACYRAWLGYYNSFSKRMGWSKEELVRQGNRYAVEALGWTLPQPPGIEPKTVGMMGLKGVPGVNIVRRTQDSMGAGGRGRARGGGNSRGNSRGGEGGGRPYASGEARGEGGGGGGARGGGGGGVRGGGFGKRGGGRGGSGGPSNGP